MIANALLKWILAQNLSKHLARDRAGTRPQRVNQFAIAEVMAQVRPRTTGRHPIAELAIQSIAKGRPVPVQGLSCPESINRSAGIIVRNAAQFLRA